MHYLIEQRMSILTRNILNYEIPRGEFASWIWRIDYLIQWYIVQMSIMTKGRHIHDLTIAMRWRDEMIKVASVNC